MASELRVNTLKDASGNNSVATSTVAQGSAKHFCIFNGTGDIAVDESFNNSSITDHAAGRYGFAVTNAFTNLHFALSGGMVGCTQPLYAFLATDNNAKTASTARFYTLKHDFSVNDSDTVDTVSHGDLA
jgi:hypothetical protein